MKVMTVLGSPRRDGNTATVLGWVEEELRARGHAVDHVDIIDKHVEPCGECYACQGVLDVPGCALTDDDALELFERMIDADALLLAVPLFCCSFPAQIKPLIDRCACLAKYRASPGPVSVVQGKRFALLVTSAGPVEDNADLLLRQFRNMVGYLMAKNAGELAVPLCTTPDALGADVHERAKGFAASIAQDAAR